MKRKAPRRLFASLIPVGLVVVALVLLLAGCEAIFTASLLSFLQRDPSKLSPEQQVTWAEQALASGDPEAMAEAYELVKNDPDNTLLAARLALELSGVGDVLSAMLQDLDTVVALDQAGLQAYLGGFVSGVDATYAAAAGTHYTAVLAADPSELFGQDMVLGALALAFAEADAGGGFAVAPFVATPVFVTDSLAALPPDDPAVDLLNLIALL
jgi:hypothetical protein